MQVVGVGGRDLPRHNDRIPYPKTLVRLIVLVSGNIHNSNAQFMAPHEVGLARNLDGRSVGRTEGFKAQTDDIRVREQRFVRKRFLMTRILVVSASKAVLHCAVATGVRVVSFFVAARADSAAP
jgi:hypothetical protein